MKPVVMDDEVRFPSIASAARGLLTSWGYPLEKNSIGNVSANICYVLSGRGKSAYGHTFRYDTSIGKVFLVTTSQGVERAFSSRDRAAEYVKAKGRSCYRIRELGIDDGEA